MNQLLKLYLRPNVWNIFDGQPLSGCRARCIDKKETKEKKKKRKKESPLAKLRSFRHTCRKAKYTYMTHSALLCCASVVAVRVSVRTAENDENDEVTCR